MSWTDGRGRVPSLPPPQSPQCHQRHLCRQFLELLLSPQSWLYGRGQTNRGKTGDAAVVQAKIKTQDDEDEAPATQLSLE